MTIATVQRAPPPDGFTNVQAVLLALQGGVTALHTTCVDLNSTSIPVGPQQILNLGGPQTIKFGFRGKTYVETLAPRPMPGVSTHTPRSATHRPVVSETYTSRCSCRYDTSLYGESLPV